MINGISYSKNKERPTMSSVALINLGIAMGINMDYSPRGRVSGRIESEIDIVGEYRLIVDRKSELSRREREWIIYQFEKNYSICK